MAEQKTTQQAVREQYKVAEGMAGNVVRAWGDLAATTSEYAFNAFEKNLGYAQEARTQADKIVHETVAGYRRIYQDGVKTWQSYVQGINEIVSRASQN